MKFGPNASRRLKGHTYSYEGPKSQFKGLQRDAYKFIIQNDIQILKCNFYLSKPELYLAFFVRFLIGRKRENVYRQMCNLRNDFK